MEPQIPSQSRRSFLKQSSSALAGAALASTIASRVYAAGSESVKVALVGCGGRGTGAAVNALSTQGPVRLHAVADIFQDRMEASLGSLARQFEGKVDVPPDRRFLGFDAYRKAIDAIDENDVVLLATPPAFRPIHFEYAVQKGRNVFMEKSFGVDSPGARRIMAAGKVAEQKNLKVAGGLMWRHDLGREAMMERIHRGDIGDLIMLRTYRMHGPVGFAPKPAGMSEVAHQIRNYNSFTWLNGSFIMDWLIHDIDILCWAKNALPVSAQGQGGRQARTVPDQLFDHMAVEYTFADGSKMFVQGRHMDQCYNIFADFFHGTKGSAALFDVLSADPPRTYRNQHMVKENESWRYDGPRPDSYQREHDLLFDAIRNNKPYNESERCAKAAIASILGRMAMESGQMITWEQAMNSTIELAPNLEKLTFDSPAPVMPDAQGRYPVAIPGKTPPA